MSINKIGQYLPSCRIENLKHDGSMFHIDVYDKIEGHGSSPSDAVWLVVLCVAGSVGHAWCWHSQYGETSHWQWAWDESPWALWSMSLSSVA